MMAVVNEHRRWKTALLSNVVLDQWQERSTYFAVRFVYLTSVGVRQARVAAFRFYLR